MLESARKRTLFGGDGTTLFGSGIAEPRRVKEARVDILRFERRISLQHSLAAGAVGEYGQYHRRRDAAPSDHGLAAHFSVLSGYAGEVFACVHASIKATAAGQAKLAGST